MSTLTVHWLAKISTLVDEMAIPCDKYQKLNIFYQNYSLVFSHSHDGATSLRFDPFLENKRI